VTGCVLIHGFTGSPASFDPLVSDLALRHPRVPLLRPALLGHGAPRAGEATRFEQEVDRLARIVSRNGFAGAHLCGYSLGARVSLGLIARHPYLFASATLIGVHPGLGDLGERATRVGSDERWCQRLRAGGLEAFLGAWEAQPLFATQRELPASTIAAQRRVRGSHSATGLERSLRVLGLGQMPDYRGVLRVVPFPVRLLAGDLDAKFSAIARRLAAGAPRALLDVVPGVGHNLLVEARTYVSNVLARALGETRSPRRGLPDRAEVPSTEDTIGARTWGARY
jgi:2-succinyl-6-hydroxy-2,4-cyclohexadiene-1-carboxylate synthase